MFEVFKFVKFAPLPLNKLAVTLPAISTLPTELIANLSVGVPVSTDFILNTPS
jgi:hypothetical protein